MSELDEFGIVRYIIDTGDKVVSILLNDIAEDDDTVLLKIKSEYVPVRSDPFIFANGSMSEVNDTTQTHGKDWKSIFML